MAHNRYGGSARFYDAISFEWPVYRVGRRRGLPLLWLRPGDRVLDIGCGTGLSFAALKAQVGESGSIVGVDASASMLQQARKRVRRHQWHGIQTINANAVALPHDSSFVPGSFDAASFSYSLSVIDDSETVWSWALSMVRPGGSVALVDLDMPSGWWRTLQPLARLACWSGGAHYRRQVWRWAERDLVDVTGSDPWGGHLRVRVGTVRPVGKQTSSAAGFRECEQSGCPSDERRGC